MLKTSGSLIKNAYLHFLSKLHGCKGFTFYEYESKTMLTVLAHFHTSLFLACGSRQKDQEFKTSLDSLRLCLNTPSLPSQKKRIGGPNRWQTSQPTKEFSFALFVCFS